MIPYKKKKEKWLPPEKGNLHSISSNHLTYSSNAINMLGNVYNLFRTNDLFIWIDALKKCL